MDRNAGAENGKDIRLIGIDLDGTLLTTQKKLTDVSRQTLIDASLSGIEVVPVTGRPLSGVPDEVLRIPGIRYVITSNGANTYDLSFWAASAGYGRDGAGAMSAAYLMENPIPPDSVLRREHLSHETVRRVLAVAEKEDVIREIFIRGIGYHDAAVQALLEARFAAKPPLMAYISRSRRIVPDFEAFLSDPSSHVENISLMFPSMERRDAAFSQLKAIRGPEGERILQVLLPWQTDLEITHVLADKWLALKALGERLGIPAGQIMALGDGDNDRPMLRGAGLSVAMGNAPAFVKETAGLLTEDNEHDGAAKAIRKLLL